ncbi:MAG TPA: hypothetical protein VGC78_01660 [Gaiellaceae bacterium]
MVPGQVRVRRVAADGELEHRHPREPELLAEAHHRLGDHAEVLRDDVERPELGLDRPEDGGAGAAAPDAVPRRPVAARDGPVGDEAAEVVDARQVDERERPAEPLEPPAEAVGAHRPPVVERVAPQLPGLRERVRRHARDEAVLEEPAVRTVVGAVPGDVDRHVAEDPDAAVARVRAQLPPLAIEPDLVLDRASVRGPVVDPVRVALAELGHLLRTHAGAGSGEQLRRSRERGGRHVRRPSLPLGRPERQHLPPPLARRGEPVDEAVGVLVQYSVRERRRMQQDS